VVPEARVRSPCSSMTAAVGAYLSAPLAGTFFINFTLLFVYATHNRHQSLYLIVIPIRMTFLALVSLGILTFEVCIGSPAHLAAMVGAAFGYAYYLSQRVRVAVAVPGGYAGPSIEANDVIVRAATRNVARVAAVKKALKTRSGKDIDRLIEASEREIVRGVNICAPPDYKPDHPDRYCIRCEGFAECTARHLRLNRPPATEPEAS